VIGTHTHVPTADARILRKGTAFITDVGMCGPYDSVIGRDTEAVVRHMTTALPVHYEMAQGDVRSCGALVEISEDTGLANRIERIELPGA
jgi:calcineurin-like phosphoesterase